VQASNGREGYKGNNQRVLHEVLTILMEEDQPQLHFRLEEQVIHCGILSLIQ